VRKATNAERSCAESTSAARVVVTLAAPAGIRTCHIIGHDRCSWSAIGCLDVLLLCMAPAIEQRHLRIRNRGAAHRRCLSSIEVTACIVRLQKPRLFELGRLPPAWNCVSVAAGKPFLPFPASRAACELRPIARSSLLDGWLRSSPSAAGTRPRGPSGLLVCNCPLRCALTGRRNRDPQRRPRMGGRFSVARSAPTPAGLARSGERVTRR
jgi:hypothetical protein